MDLRHSFFTYLVLNLISTVLPRSRIVWPEGLLSVSPLAIVHWYLARAIASCFIIFSSTIRNAWR